MGTTSTEEWRALVIGAVSARQQTQLTTVTGTTAIDVPGVIGLLGVRCFIYVHEATSPVRLAEAVQAAELSSFVLIAGKLGGELDQELVARGWSFRRTLDMMVLPLVGAVQRPSAEASVTLEIIDRSNLEEAQALSDAAFGSGADVASLVESPHGHAQLARSPDGHAVAMGGWVTAGDGARILNIATIPAHRGRGLGGLMTMSAVGEAQAAGARFAYLEATSEGAGVYRRVGFQTLDTWRVFHRLQATTRTAS